MSEQALTNYDETWAKQAKQQAAEEPQTGAAFLSIKAGVLSYKVGGEEEALPGNQVCVVIVDSIHENGYHDRPYVEGSKEPPICYAFARGDDEIAPHPSMQVDLDYFQPQSDVCATCPHMAWGSAPVGRGKACKERRRLALIPAGMYLPRKGSRDMDLELFDEADHFATAELMFLKLPVTSVKIWGKYVNMLANEHQRPAHGVITRLYVEPDAENQFAVRFEMLEKVPDELAAAVIARHEAARAIPFQGYQPPNPEQEQRSVRGLRRGR